MHIRHSVLIFIFLASCLIGRAQDSLFFNKAIQALGSLPAQEKVYLHLDKPNYGFGDTIWYKAYTVIGQHHQLSALSGVLYVELINPKDSLVTRQMLPLVSGVSWSDIPLAYTLKPGTYRIRAYTRWMENEGPGCFYDQKVVIGGLNTIHTSTAAEKPDVQFFPEGGQLVNGVRSRVAVKAVGTNGLGVNVKGSIEDNNGTVVADFATQHLGMGEFAFVPEAGKTYKARIQVSGETAFTFDLPKAEDLGYTLTINNSEKDSVYLRVAINEQTLNRDKGKSFYIIAQNNGKVFYTTQGKLESTAYAVKAAKDRFPMGITRFTLFDEGGQPIAERIAFLNNKETGELKLDLTTETQEQKIKIDLTASDPDNRPRQGSFSVSVINADQVQPDESGEGSILNNLLLTSELKGYIEQPNYYFTRISEKTEADLDNLMLTQGYRRYEWKQLLSNNLTTQPSGNSTLIKPERTQEIIGTLTTPGGKPIPNGKVTLVGLKENILRDTTANEQGGFTFDNLAIKDTATLVVKARKMNNGSNVIIKATEPEYPKIDMRPYNDALVITDTIKAKQRYEQYARAQKNYQFRFGKVLKEVKITGLKRPKPDLSKSSNLNGGGNADQVIMAKDLPNMVNLATALDGQIRGVQIYFDGDGSIDGDSYAANSRIMAKGSSPAGAAMAVIVDGNILAPGELSHITLDEVYSVEVLRSGASMAIYGSSLKRAGALVITTKMAAGVDYHPQVILNGITTLKYNGFYKSKTFYIPKYTPKANEVADQRTTVYWNPNILTGKDGKSTAEFTNTGQKGVFRVVVEGIDDDGNLGRKVYWYNVQ